MEYKIEGLKELEQAIRDLADEYGPKSSGQAIRPAIRKTFAPLVPEVQAKTPKRTGRLAGSVRISISKPAKREINGIGGYIPDDVILAGFVGYDPKKAGKKSIYRQAVAVEYGNSKMPAHAPLRNTLDAHASRITGEFKRELAKAIESTAVKLFNKRVKG